MLIDAGQSKTILLYKCGGTQDSGVQRGGSDQLVISAQSCLGAIAGVNDDLLQRHGGDVACGEHAGHRGLSLGIDHAFVPVGVRHKGRSVLSKAEFDFVAV